MPSNVLIWFDGGFVYVCFWPLFSCLCCHFRLWLCIFASDLRCLLVSVCSTSRFICSMEAWQKLRMHIANFGHTQKLNLLDNFQTTIHLKSTNIENDRGKKRKYAHRFSLINVFFVSGINLKCGATVYVLHKCKMKKKNHLHFSFESWSLNWCVCEYRWHKSRSIKTVIYHHLVSITAKFSTAIKYRRL